MNEYAEPSANGLIDAIRENASLTVTTGIVLIIAGTLALFSPLVAGLSITILVGAMLAVGGIGQCGDLGAQRAQLRARHDGAPGTGNRAVVRVFPAIAVGVSVLATMGSDQV